MLSHQLIYDKVLFLSFSDLQIRVMAVVRTIHVNLKFIVLFLDILDGFLIGEKI